VGSRQRVVAGLIRITLSISGITAKMETTSGIFGGILRNYTEETSGFQGTSHEFTANTCADSASRSEAGRCAAQLRANPRGRACSLRRRWPIDGPRGDRAPGGRGNRDALPALPKQAGAAGDPLHQ